MHSSSSLKLDILDEPKWVENICKAVDEQYDEETKIPVCIITVPKVLSATDPKSYTPQHVALGPLHHSRPEVQDMQRYKIDAARRTRKDMNVSLKKIVEKIKEDQEAHIRACYRTFLSMCGNTLVWLMVVDIAFLLDFLQVYLEKQRGQPTVDVTMNLSHMAILRDVVKAENQIPLFLLQKMLAYKTTGEPKSADADVMMKTMLIGLYRDLTPFVEKEEELQDVPIEKCFHLLDFLYHMTVPNSSFCISIDYPSTLVLDTDEINIEKDQTSGLPDPDGKEDSFGKQIEVQRAVKYVLDMLMKIRIIQKLKSTLEKPVASFSKSPLPAVFKKMFESFFGGGQEISKEESGETKAPKIEEITIPSVTQMAKAGIHFKPVNGGISNISFDVKTCTLYLPVVELDVNTEVYLRNLVAYEACVATGPLVMARYTELMNGIIDTEQDAKYLQERNIVLNRLKSDKEVADLWNGMSKSVKLTNVQYMDIVVADVNKMYSQTWRVKSSKLLKKYVFASWKILTLLAALLMLFLTTVQAFCSVYSCARVFHQIPEIPAQGVE